MSLRTTPHRKFIYLCVVRFFITATQRDRLIFVEMGIIIVLLLILAALTAVSIIRLLLKTWSSIRSLTFKISCTGAVIAFIVFCIYDFNNQAGKYLTLTIFGAILIISFDWTLGILNQRIFRRNKLNPIIIIPTLTIGLSLVIFFGMYGLGILLDKLKLLE